MIRFLLVLLAVVAIALGAADSIPGIAESGNSAAVEEAQAHTSYKNHGCYYWSVATPNGPINYRECLREQAGCSNHSHTYLTEYRRYVSGVGWIWWDVHEHIRFYACHVV